MIRTLWFYLVLLVSTVIHATGVILAALVGVKRRPGGGGVNVQNNDVRVDFAVRVPHGVRFVGANVSGNIRVEGLRGEVRVATVSGNVNIQPTEFAARATTVSGSVVLELPAGANATVHANSVSGRIDSDFPGLSDVGSSIPTGDSSSAVGRRRLPIVEGTIGSGGPELRVTTVSGNIRLRQR